MKELTILEKECVLTAIRNMFKSKNFSICTINDCLKITGGIHNQRDLDALDVLHCVPYSEMSPELRDAVFSKTLEVLSAEGFDLTILDMEFNRECGDGKG